jgi:hypothetical protein
MPVRTKPSTAYEAGCARERKGPRPCPTCRDTFVQKRARLIVYKLVACTIVDIVDIERKWDSALRHVVETGVVKLHVMCKPKTMAERGLGSRSGKRSNGVNNRDQNR